MNSLARMALVLYCAVQLIIPLSYLHVENPLAGTKILTNSAHQETDLLVLIHEALYSHLCNVTDHLSEPIDRISDPIDQMSESLFPDGMALKLFLLSLSLLAAAFYAVRRYSLKRGKTLPQTIFCYRLFDHSPPSPCSL